MKWSRVMFAVANPDSVDSAVLDKVVRLTIALGAELDLFHCANGLLVPQPQRLGFFEDEHNVGDVYRAAATGTRASRARPSTAGAADSLERHLGLSAPRGHRPPGASAST